VGELKAAAQRVLAEGEPGPGRLREFPRWSRSWISRVVRRANLALWLAPLVRLLARPAVSGLENLRGLDPPLIFASNHQSHLDTPLILAALPSHWRYRIAPAMYKEYFEPYFSPRKYPLARRIWSGLQYFLVTLLFNAFP